MKCSATGATTRSCFPQLSYDSTRGLLLSAYLQRTSYGFGLDPEESQMKFGAAYATSLDRLRIEYGADFRTRSPLRGLVYVAYSGLEQARFFGFGNDTVRNSNLASNGFYDARQDQITVNPVAEVALFGGCEHERVSSSSTPRACKRTGGSLARFSPRDRTA